MSSRILAAAVAVFAVLLHLATANGYGYFRDELYYLDCGRHPAWGYVDMAPLAPWVVWLLLHTIGVSLFALRLLPALAAGAKILLTGQLVREMGGERRATALACLCVLAAGVYLAIDSFFSMNTFEPLFWMGAACVLARAIRLERPQLLPWVGVLVGVGLENKHSTIFFAAAVALALVLSPQRRWLRTRWPWIAAAIAVAFFLPNFLWQWQHNWPTYEDLSNVKRMHKNVELPPWPFLLAQIDMMLPFSLPVWLAGLWFLMADKAGRTWRLLGFTFLGFFLILMAMKGKDYYLAPIYPMMFAAGAVWWSQRPKWTSFALGAIVTCGGVIAALLTLPLESPDRYLEVAAALGHKQTRTEVAHSGLLPQHLSDRFGWPEMVAKVAQVYQSLPPEERAHAAIVAGNYGEAGAINLMGPAYGLPTAVSGHQNHFYWGPGYAANAQTIIVLQSSRASLERACLSVEEGPRVGHRFAMSEENFPIYICRSPRVPLAELWPKLKHWN